MCMNILSEACLCATYAPGALGVKSSATEVTDGYESPDGCWELNLGPLQERKILSTAELTLQLKKWNLIN